MKQNQTLVANVPCIITSGAIDTYLNSLRSGKRSEKTIKRYHEFLRQLLARYSELPWEPEPLESLINSYPNDSTAHHCYRTLKAFYNFVCKRYQIAEPSPMQRVLQPKVAKKEKPTLDDQQLTQLLEYECREDLKVMLYLLALTGMRLGEALSLESCDVLKDSIRIRGKTGERIIPVDLIVIVMLHKLGPGQYGASPDRFFPGNVRRWSQRVTGVFKKLELPGSAHNLRHTFATEWTGTDSALKYILGHSSWFMVDHYRHKKDARALQEYQNHSPMRRLFGEIAPFADTETTPAVLREARQIVDTLAGAFPGESNSTENTKGDNHKTPPWELAGWPPKTDDEWRAMFERISDGRVIWLSSDKAHPGLVNLMLHDTFRHGEIEDVEYFEILRSYCLSQIDENYPPSMGDLEEMAHCFNDGYVMATLGQSSNSSNYL